MELIFVPARVSLRRMKGTSVTFDAPNVNMVFGLFPIANVFSLTETSSKQTRTEIIKTVITSFPLTVRVV